MQPKTMLLAILNYITDSGKTALTAVTSAAIGQAAAESKIDVANIALQHTAWFIAILAGILSIVNYFYPLRSWYEEKKARRIQKPIKQQDEDENQNSIY